MEKLTKLKIRVVSSTALLIFAIFGFLSVNGSLAWFSNNKQVQSSGMAIQSVVEEVIVGDYEIYKYDAETQKGVLCEDTAVIMREYDSVFTERNVHTSLIIKIPVRGPLVQSGEAFTVTVNCTEGLYVSDSTEVADYLSNVIRIKTGTVNALSGVTDANEIYVGATGYFENESSLAFVSVLGDEASKRTAITFTVENYTASEMVDLYVEIDYEPALIGHYLGHSEGKIASGSFLSNEVILTNDVVSVVLGKTAV